MGVFDPTSLQATKLSEGDLADMVVDAGGEIGLAGDKGVRQRCASARLAAQIVTRAYATSQDLSDQSLLTGMSAVLARHAAVRKVCLEYIGVPPSSADYGAAFAAASAMALDVLTEEFKWRQIGARTEELSMGLLARLMDAVSSNQEILFGKSVDQMDDTAVRRLGVLQATPAMMSLVNLFDYFNVDRDAMVLRLVYAVAGQAEYHLGAMGAATGFSKTLAIQRVYMVSTTIMTEVYKACAYKDVGVLRDLQDVDRSIEVAQYERIGGMDYGHVLREHERVMNKTIELCDVIVKAHVGEKESGNGSG